MSNDKVTLEYENNRGNAKKIHEWVKVGPNIVKETDNEVMYNYQSEEWETVHEHTRTYEITDSGFLVGDGSNWDGDGRMWEEWATERFQELIRIRFPYDFDDSKTPTTGETDKELIKDLAVKNWS